MADRKATNKYYPPDWDPSKGSINTYVGQHPLRDRARKLDQGILIVRFEMPYSIWCNGCDKSIGQGVRFNAEKKTIGKYYSTAILSFRMKCHQCNNWIEIQTDPKNAAYVVTAGARKKIEDFDAKDSETLELDTPEEFERRSKDKFAKLEHVQKDALQAKTNQTYLTRLQLKNDRQWSDPYALSQRLRKEFRTDKKAKKKEADECQSVANRVGFAFGILPESESDRQGSKRIEFEKGTRSLLESRMKEIKSGGLFSKQQGSSLSRRIQPGIGSKRPNDAVVQALTLTVKVNTRMKVDPFLAPSHPKISQDIAAAKRPLVEYQESDDDTDDL